MRSRTKGPPYRRGAPLARLRSLPVLLSLLVALAGCGVTDTGPVAAGAPARGGQPGGATALRVYLVTPYGTWPAARPAPDGAGPQAALDALLAGPTRAERSRGLGTALPAGAHRVRAQPLRGAVALYLPWLVSELDRVAVNQLVCTAAASPGIPGGEAAADVVVRVHESATSGAAWPVRCDDNGAAAPVDSGGPPR